MFPDVFPVPDEQILELVQPIPRCKCKQAFDQTFNKNLHCTTARCSDKFMKIILTSQDHQLKFGNIF